MFQAYFLTFPLNRILNPSYCQVYSRTNPVILLSLPQYKDLLVWKRLQPLHLKVYMNHYLCQGLLNMIRYPRSEEHTSELQSRGHLVCRLLLEKKNTTNNKTEKP